LLELGGTARPGGAPSDSGAAYDPTDQRWRPIASAPPTVLPAGGASVWAGRRIFIFGGPAVLNHASGEVAGLYDPAVDRWTVTRKAPVGPFINTPNAVWTGQRVILAGMTGGHPKLELASYDPASNTWTSLQAPISPQRTPLGLAMVATNDGVLLWSLLGRTTQTGPNTGKAEISYNASGEITGPHTHVLPGDTAILNVHIRKWSRGPSPPLQVSDAPAVWSGTQLYALAHNGTLMAYGR
jgi:hypothetical protein